LISLDLNNLTSYSYDNLTSYSYNLTLFGNTYTLVAVTNATVSNFTLSETGLGVQVQAEVPSGTIGFCNVTVPAALIDSIDVNVFEDGVPLGENVDYTKERMGSDYLFHIAFTSGVHTFAAEAAILNPSTSSPTSSPSSQNQGGLPTETVITVVAVGAAVATSIAVLYLLKGTILHALGKGGVGAAKVPQPTGGGSVNVSVGTNVTVHPDPRVQLTFSQVNQAGLATATPTSNYPALPKGISFRGTVFDIKTAAVFTGIVTVGLLFDGTGLTEKEKKKLRVYRNDLKKDSVWEDVTSSIDTKNNIAYGSTDHFSVFGVR
jgi:hypothetical protein